MTDLQLFILVAVPTLSVLLHYIFMRSTLKRLERRLDEPFGETDERISKP